jgi:hypothetical protein
MSQHILCQLVSKFKRLKDIKKIMNPVWSSLT